MVSAEKARLRLETLARRDALPADQRIEKSLLVAEHGQRELAVAPGQVVSGFMPIRSEPDIRPLMAVLAERGARLCVPVILDRQTIVFRELVRGAPLVASGFGTVGPGPEAALLDPELMLVPLAAFDGSGNRIGYGAGHYDRAIGRLHAKGLRPRLVGIAFDLQEIAAVPIHDHDRALDAVLTESGLRSFAAPL
ncbi:MAG: 5-formyltetrahydrofolate cyclo-ligase [Pararhizobium sp.]